METKLFICSCKKGQKLKLEDINRLKDFLGEKGINYTEFEDFCGAASKESSKINFPENAILIGCQPRAMEHLLNYSDFELNGNTINFYHINDILEEKADLDKNISNSSVEKIEYELDWKPWFPVIDYEKCTNCKQCMDFCLFGVYELDSDKLINVKNPENCKDLCPACSRVCPAQAIIFPKHDGSPIDGGPGEFEMDAQYADMAKEDVYKLLLARRKRLKAHLLKKNQLKLAEEERKKCSEGSKPAFEFNIVETSVPCCPTDSGSAESGRCNCECANMDAPAEETEKAEIKNLKNDSECCPDGNCGC